MIRGIYSAASGMVANFRRQQIIANNLANVSTAGFKQDVAAPSDFPDMTVVGQNTRKQLNDPWDALGSLGSGTELSEIIMDLSQGDLSETGNPLDLAISGPGYFAIQTPAGTYYTRDGAFHRNATGYLVRQDGGFLLGENGPIQAGYGDILIDGDGTVIVDGQETGRIRLVDFDLQENMVRIGNSYVAPQNPAAVEMPAAGAALSQGYLERSNVDLTRASVEMMAALRSYEANQRMIVLQDQSLGLTVNEVGKV